MNPEEEHRIRAIYGLDGTVLDEKTIGKDGKPTPEKKTKISFWTFLRIIMSEEGMFGVYRGIGANVLTTIVAQGCYFLWYTPTWWTDCLTSAATSRLNVDLRRRP